MPRRPLNLYIHIPFCLVKCGYCDFYSVAKGEDFIGTYVQALLAENRFFARRHAQDYRVETVFFGGGTPSYVPAGDIARILQSVRESWQVDAHAEITLETNPSSAEAARLRQHVAMGVNRLSVGVQSFRDEELGFLGRAHSAQEARYALRMLKESGIPRWSMDLIFGLPSQTQMQWQENVEEALSFDPGHISTYNLTYEQGTPLHGMRLSGNVKPLGEDAELAMYRWTMRRLRDAGLMQYEISNFAKPGQECRHNVGIWQAAEYLGLGAGAHSYMDGRRFSKKRDLHAYIKTAAGMQPEYDEDLPAQRRLGELIAIGLRDLRGIDTDRLASSLSGTAAEVLQGKVQPWLDSGHLRREDGRLSLTKKGVLFYDAVARSLL